MRPRSSRTTASLVAVVACSACSPGLTHGAPSVADDGGDDDAGPVLLTYTPQGCQYAYTPPAVLGYTDMALDSTTAPVDPTTGVPVRVRVGLGGGTAKGQPGYADPTTTAAFTWETTASNQAAEVKMGATPATLTAVHTGYSWTTPKELSTTAVYLHEVHVCGLTPDTTYYYQVGGGPAGAQLWSATQSFTTVPATGAITVGLIGDARDSVGTWQAVNLRMRDAAVAMALIDGDLVDLGTVDDLYMTWLDAIWHDPSDATKFLTLGQIPLVPVNGNHENDSAISFANWATPGDGPYAETYASFDVGSAHVTMIDDQQIAESIELGGASTEAQAQLAWLDQDLAAANADRKDHPFIVVMGHRGLFSTSNHAADGDVIAARGALVPIYDKYNVDLVVNGHDHEYERSLPLRAGSPASGAPVVGAGTTYVICAGSGADPYAVGTAQASYNAGVQVAFCTPGQAGCTSPYIGTYALLSLTPTSMTLTAYGLKASGSTVADDVVIDTFTVMAP